RAQLGLGEAERLEHRLEVLLLLLELGAHVGHALVDLGAVDGDRQLAQVLVDEDVIDQVVEQLGPGLGPLVGRHALQAALHGRLGDGLPVDHGGHARRRRGGGRRGRGGGGPGGGRRRPGGGGGRGQRGGRGRGRRGGGRRLGGRGQAGQGGGEGDGRPPGASGTTHGFLLVPKGVRGARPAPARGTGRASGRIVATGPGRAETNWA